jgi:regulator of sigma E protease
MTGSILTSVVAFIIAIGILVTVHEFGHFWVARRLGFKVLRFSLGFGKPLLTRVSRDADRVEYVLAAVPLGGYVRLLDERDGPVAPGEESRAFNRRPPLARIAVLLAGPGANFLFAIVAYWFLFMQGVPGLKPLIGEIAPDSYAAHADLRALDTITAVGGKPTATQEAAVLGILDGVVGAGEVTLAVRDESGRERTLTLRVPADGRRALTEPGMLLSGLGFSFWHPAQDVIAGEVTPGMPAALAGIRAGDRIVEVEGRAIRDRDGFIGAVSGRAGLTTRVTVVRDGERRTLELVPQAVEEAGRTMGRVGIVLPPGSTAAWPESMRTVERYGAASAIGPAVRETWNKSALTVRFLWRMVAGDVSTKNISGPINIAQYAGLTATEGFTYYLAFLALVSISLAVLNLLPVPVLDGGQVVFQVAEMAKGSPLSMKAQLLGQKVGIAMLVALMGFAFYNDISRLFG